MMFFDFRTWLKDVFNPAVSPPAPALTPTPTPAPAPARTPTPTATTLRVTPRYGVPVPANNIYLGVSDDTSKYVFPALETFQQRLGQKLAFVPVFLGFGKPLSPQILYVADEIGVSPQINLACANVDHINTGVYDDALLDLGRVFRQYGKPLMLRWCWEMNKASPGRAEYQIYGRGHAYIAAWQRIRDYLPDNISMIWCPSANDNDPSEYYPGDTYVDWIAFDGFLRADKPRLATFEPIWSPSYDMWKGRKKPMMIGATGTYAAKQVEYLTDMRRLLPTRFPQIKAVRYFNGVGDNIDCVLRGAGWDAFKRLAADPYFAAPSWNAL